MPVRLFAFAFAFAFALAAFCGSSAFAEDKPKADPTLAEIERAKKASLDKPDDANLLFALGSLYLKARKPEQGVETFTAAIKLKPELLEIRDRRGDAYLWLGKFTEAIEDYDAFLKANPKIGPQHWRRGIALYYAGKFEEGVKQFDTHKTVNPEDVENAAWHYLCNSKVIGGEKARKGLIEVTRDSRIPMAEIQKLFAGSLKPEDVLAVAAKAKGAEKTSALFYANLYVALWYDAEGDAKKVREHLEIAVEKHAVPDYMWDVGNAHLKMLKAKDTK